MEHPSEIGELEEIPSHVAEGSDGKEPAEDDGGISMPDEVRNFGKQYNRTEAEIEKAIAVLDENWVAAMGDFLLIAESEPNCLSLKLPGRLYHHLKGLNKKKSDEEDEMEDARRRAKDIFDRIDKDQSGGIDVTELQQMLHDLGEEVRPEEIERIYAKIDKDNDGEIKFEEFYAWWTRDEKSSGAEVSLRSLKSKMSNIKAPETSFDLLEAKVISIFAENKVGHKWNPYKGLVCVKVYVNELTNLNTAEGTIHADIGLLMWYWDSHVEKLVETGEAPTDSNLEWFPEIEFRGNIDLNCIYENHGWFTILEKLGQLGIVQCYQRFRGSVRQDMDLTDFPFDSHTLRFKCAYYCDDVDCCHFVDVTDEQYMQRFTDNAAKLHEWQPKGPGRIEIGTYWDEYDVSEINIVIDLRRKSEFYFRNIFSTIFCLNILSWGIFGIPICEFGDRLNLCVTLFLALVAFAFVLAEHMPKVSHATPLTNYLTLNYLIISVTAMESFIVFILTNLFPDAADEIRNVEYIFVFAIIAIETTLYTRFYFR